MKMKDLLNLVYQIYNKSREEIIRCYNDWSYKISEEHAFL